MGGAVELPPTLTTCNLGGAPNVGEGDSLVSIDSFDDDDAAFSGAGLNGGWYAYGDGTAGTLLTSDGFVPVPGGVEGGAFRVQAGGFTGWGSVFGAYLSEGCLFDGARYDGITFYAKGHVTGAPSEAVSVRLVGLDDITPELGGLCEADCWNSPHFEIEIEEDCYRRYSIRFDEFLRLGETTGQLAPEELYLIDFAIGMADSSDIWVDQLSFFTGDKPAPEEICD